MHTTCPRAMQQGKDGTGAVPVPVVPGVPEFGCLTFEDAIQLFRGWGFQVEPGPRPEEVTLILEGRDYRSYWVHDARDLAGMAAVALRLRWQNGALTPQPEERGNHRTAGRTVAELVS